MESGGRLLTYILSCYLVTIAIQVSSSFQSHIQVGAPVSPTPVPSLISASSLSLTANKLQVNVHRHSFDAQQQQQQQHLSTTTNNNNKGSSYQIKLGCSAPVLDSAAPEKGVASAHGATSGLNSVQDQNQLVEQTTGFIQSQVSTYARPTYYTLRLKLDPIKRKFTGQLMISLEIAPPTVVDETDGYRYLTLNAASNIHISRAFYVFGAGGGVQVPATGIARDPIRELITLDFYPNLITQGQGLLLLAYTGSVNETESQGLFLHHSQRVMNNQQQAATDFTAGLATHMQPSFARRLLPSWDEPLVRARFSLILVLPFRGYQTISNMPVQRKSISLSCSGEPLQEVEFQPTPIMPIYLLTLVVGRFDYIEAYTANKCRVRVYVYSAITGPQNGTTSSTNTSTNSNSNTNSNQRRQSAQLALEVAVKTLELLEVLTGVSYPLSKLDLIALREFNSGGMENWGATIFHENYLLVDQTAQNFPEIQLNGGRSRPKRRVIPLVVAHELAHQWFGNLVSPASWNYLWLSEGFAQMLMYELAEHLYPAHQYWRIFIEDSRQAALHDDQLLTGSHALEPRMQVQAASESEQMSSVDQLNLFDQITYNKGALVVKMLYHLLGKETFYSGLRHYLLSNSYQSIQSRELWRALEERAKLPETLLSTMMHSWLTYEGFPLISVQAFEDPSRSDKLMLRLTQDRFSLLSIANLTVPDEPSIFPAPSSSSSSSSLNQSSSFASETNVNPASVWWIPVGVASEVAPNPSDADLKLELSKALIGKAASSRAFLMRDRIILLSLSKTNTGSWLKLNHNASGYFRVDYLVPLEPDGSRSVLLEEPKQIDLLARMAVAIRDHTMTDFDRFNLIDDLFALVRAGKKPTAFYLRYLLEAYANETEPIVLRPIVDSLRKLRSLFSNSGPTLVSLLDNWVKSYLILISNSMAASIDKEALELLETAKLYFNGSHAFAFDLFNRHFRSPSNRQAVASSVEAGMDRELKAAAYSRALNEANEQDYNIYEELDDNEDTFTQLLRSYESSEFSAERHAIAVALGSLESPNLQRKQSKLLNITLYESYFKAQDVATLLDSMGRTKSGRALIWSSLSANPSVLEKHQMLSPILKSFSHGLIESDQANESVEKQLRTLFAAYQSEHGRVISQAIEILLVNTNWFKRDLFGLTVYLEQFQAQQQSIPL